MQWVYGNFFHPTSPGESIALTTPNRIDVEFSFHLESNDHYACVDHDSAILLCLYQGFIGALLKTEPKHLFLLCRSIQSRLLALFALAFRLSYGGRFIDSRLWKKLQRKPFGRFKVFRFAGPKWVKFEWKLSSQSSSFSINEEPYRIELTFCSLPKLCCAGNPTPPRTVCSTLCWMEMNTPMSIMYQGEAFRNSFLTSQKNLFVLSLSRPSTIQSHDRWWTENSRKVSHHLFPGNGRDHSRRFRLDSPEWTARSIINRRATPGQKLTSHSSSEWNTFFSACFG